MGRPLASPAAAIAVMTLTVACGGSSDQPGARAQASSGAPQARTATAEMSPAAAAASHTTSATPTPDPTAGRACTAADLTAIFLRESGATGDVVLSFGLRNRTTVICHTYGWPGVEFLGAGGHGLLTRSRRVTRDLLGSTHASVVALAPGRWASFRVIATDRHSGGGTARCRIARAIRIVVPDHSGTMSIEIPDGAYECSVATVTALEAGDVAIR